MDQNASFSVYRTVKAYWSNLASQKSLQDIKITMETAQNTSQTLKQRKDGGELAEVDYQRALAELRLRGRFRRRRANLAGCTGRALARNWN